MNNISRIFMSVVLAVYVPIVVYAGPVSSYVWEDNMDVSSSSSAHMDWGPLLFLLSLAGIAAVLFVIKLILELWLCRKD